MPIDKHSAQFITNSVIQPTQSSAPGIWRLEDVNNSVAGNRWPLAPNLLRRSLRFNTADTAYLSRTPAAAGNRTTWTWSGWVKRSTLSVENDIFGLRIDGNNQFRFFFNTSDKLDIYNQISATIGARLITTQVFRDISSWYHIVFVADTNNVTAGDRFRLYINGNEVTAFDTDTQPSSGYSTQINTTNPHYLGYFSSASFNGYMTEVNFIDGQTLTPASFAETDPQTGVWVPKLYTGTYGTNGFRLNFSNNSSTTTLGYDSSGLGNNWTANNFSVASGAGNDSLLDTPSMYGADTGLGGEVGGNYCVGNWTNSSDPSGYLTDGSLRWAVDNTRVITSTFIMTEGKWYCEATPFAIITALEIGIIASSISWSSTNFNSPGSYASGYTYLSGGNKYNNNSSTTYGASYTTNDVIGIAFDADARTITFYKNGVSQGIAFSSITAGSYVICARATGIGSAGFIMNFGQRPFAFPAPAGYKCLTTQNLSTPLGNVSATQANKYFNTILWTGDGTTSRTISGIGFRPDFVWAKRRNIAGDHGLMDSLRGATARLISNSTAQEDTTFGLSAFTDDGFITNASNTAYNVNSDTHVAWCWNAGGTTATNTSGTITSSVRANQAAGFSVVSYTGTGSNGTVGHGLNAVPQFVVVRNRDTVYNWRVWHTALSGTQLLYLNTTDATVTDATMWNSTIPTSTVFNLGTNGGVNESTKKIIAYCWAAVPGFSAFGSYTGNASADGSFVYLGFKPAFILIKDVNNLNSWILMDNKRTAAYNPQDGWLVAQSTDAEYNISTSDSRIDFLSNGFKLRNSNAGNNGSARTHIYAAFAETPFKNTRAR